MFISSKFRGKGKLFYFTYQPDKNRIIKFIGNKSNLLPGKRKKLRLKKNNTPKMTPDKKLTILKNQFFSS
ncbi:MAG: hypothetical protein EGP82_11980 [Odoribacter splanchnicus]|nr:hypothetical protein [Odoribacter splanchnicus]